MSDIKIRKDGIVINHIQGQNVDAWIYDGSKGWFLFPEEKKLPPEELFNLIKTKHLDNGLFRCTACGVEMKKNEVAGWPLFAGIACAKHWAQHVEQTDAQRKAGQVCRFCGQPYNNCSC